VRKEDAGVALAISPLLSGVSNAFNFIINFRDSAFRLCVTLLRRKRDILSLLQILNKKVDRPQPHGSVSAPRLRLLVS
jgi:hypothetical protein